MPLSVAMPNLQKIGGIGGALKRRNFPLSKEVRCDNVMFSGSGYHYLQAGC